MKYRQHIDPELQPIAKNIPYNRAVITCANLFLAASYPFVSIPKELRHQTITLKGYRDLPFPVDLFEPAAEKGPLPCLLYLHGGAFSYRASAHHKKLACLYAWEAKCRVYFPHYHLAPKYPYPAAYEDVLALYRYVLDHAEELSIDPERVGLAGDSAGGALAALLCNRYAIHAVQRPRLQLLIYPLTDVAMATASIGQFPDTPLWNARHNRRMWAYYCRDLSAERIYTASPMHGGLPPVIPDTYIETAEYDCLRDEGVLYAEKLRKAGARVVLNQTRGTIHGYDCVLTSEIAVRNIEKRISFLRSGFYGAPSAH